MSSAIRLFIKFTLGGEFMNGSTFCEIKYMKGYRIGVGLKILARTPIPKLPTKKESLVNKNRDNPCPK